MQIASQHSEAVGQRARVGVKERLLLDGITLHAADVSPRYIQRAAAVVPHFANAGLSLRDGAAMPACVTADAVAIKFLVKIAFAHLLVDNFAQCSHRIL